MESKEILIIFMICFIASFLAVLLVFNIYQSGSGNGDTGNGGGGVGGNEIPTHHEKTLN